MIIALFIDKYNMKYVSQSEAVLQVRKSIHKILTTYYVGCQVSPTHHIILSQVHLTETVPIYGYYNSNKNFHAYSTLLHSLVSFSNLKQTVC